MSDSLWSFDQLARFTRYEDPEVRCWAAERLMRLFPSEASDVVADLILDEHEATPDLVAEHLGRHGGPHHVPILLKGFRRGTGLTPGRCIEALARLGYEATARVAAEALHQRDVPESCLGLMVISLAGMAGRPGGEAATGTARDFLLRRPELFAEPAALKAAVGLFAPGDFGDVILKWITALHFTGPGEVESCVRVLLEELQLEDCGWCVRTDREGRVDLPRTLKAIESGFDLEVRSSMPPEAQREIAARLQEGQLAEIAASLGGYIRARARAASERRCDDPLPRRLDSLGAALMSRPVVETAERLGPALQQWLIGVMIAAAVKVTLYRNYLLELQEAGQDLDQLLGLAGAETSCLLSRLPERLAAAARGAPVAERGRTIDWCVKTLEARGPFFPKSIALETLGLLECSELIPEIASHLADDNAYIYGAAERALARMGRAVVDHARLTLRRGAYHPDALQSLIRLACEAGREEALRLLLDHFDEIFEALGPEAASEAAALLGHRDLIPHLRRWLPRSQAMVGHSLLLIGSINNLPVPEEESILKAIDDYWRGAEPESGAGSPGQYLM